MAPEKEKRLVKSRIVRFRGISNKYVGEHLGKLLHFHVLFSVFSIDLQFLLFCVVTRSKSRLFKQFNIKNCYIKLNISFKSITLDWLERNRPIVQNQNANAADTADENAANNNALNENADPVRVQIEGPQEKAVPERIVQRRGTFAGGSLFDVGNQTREFGSDFLPKYQTYRLVRSETENQIDDPASHIEAEVGNDEIIQLIESVNQAALEAANSLSNNVEIVQQAQHVIETNKKN